MIKNKLLALILSLCTAGGVTAGVVANTDVTLPQALNKVIVQKQEATDLNNGQATEVTIDKDSTIPNVINPSNNTNAGGENTNPTVPVVEAPKAETPAVEKPKVQAPVVQAPVKEVPKTQAPKVEQPATTPSTTVPSGVPANPNNKSFKYLDAVEKEILTYVNQARTAQGLKPLAWEENMRPIARYKSNNMLQYNYFEHNTPSLNNAGPMDLATKYFKYNTNGYGENIFYSMGYPEATTTAKYLVDQWMNSPGHRANILNANWTKMSAGVVFSSQGNYVYATQHFSTK